MRALISVSDKTGVAEFAKELSNLGYEIISTGGTAKALKQNGIKTIDISDVTKFPEMMDGRVKTLHPAIHGGLLAIRDNKEHMETIKNHNIIPIDVVVVNLYPFEATISKDNVTLEDAIENIDIGGPSMVRSAAKNFENVAIIVNPKRYPEITKELKKNNGELSKETKSKLAVEAFEHTSKYDTIIFNYLNKTLQKGAIPIQEQSLNNTSADVTTDVATDVAAACPERSRGGFSLRLDKLSDLRYGENPHQKAYLYKEENGSGIVDFKQLHGKELSFNNFIDLDAAWNIARDFKEPCAAVMKHTNPCGTAIGKNISEAYAKALSCDPVSAFGSVVGLNQTVDKTTAEQINSTFIEAVIAPGFEEEALNILKQKKNIRLIIKPNFFTPPKDKDFKKITGGFLVQDRDLKNISQDQIKIVTKKEPHNLEDLIFAWKVVKHIKSNAIVLVKDGMTIGVGAGQMSRVDSVEIAIKKAKELVKDSVLASDAFFPFRDSVDIAAKAGVKAIIQPGGSMRDQESIDACNEHGIAMVFTGMRHFKH